jgi:uncharacterized protein (DUF983 family)
MTNTVKHPIDRPIDRPIFQSIMRGIARRCASCGEGAVLAGYLKPVEECAHCGEDFRNIRADDGPAWITILVLGHIIVPLMIYLGRDDTVPVWAATILLSVIMLVGVWFVLPRAKGMFIALIWATGATGKDMSPEDMNREKTK